jgi:hypothetical protein
VDNDSDVITEDHNMSIEDYRRPSIPPQPIPKEVLKRRQNAAKPPVSRSKPSRGKPPEIPKITVEDFGELENPENPHRNEADLGSPEIHVEPTVVIENEVSPDATSPQPASKTKKKGKDVFGAAAKTFMQKNKKDRVADSAAVAFSKSKTSNKSKLSGKDDASKEHIEKINPSHTEGNVESGLPNTSEQENSTKNTSSSKQTGKGKGKTNSADKYKVHDDVADDDDVVVVAENAGGDDKDKDETKTQEDVDSTKKSTKTLGKAAAKSKFSSILARFQKMGDG